MDLYRDGAAIGREWMERAFTACNELLALQLERCQRRYETNVAELLKVFQARGVAELIEDQQQSWNRWWQDEAHFARSSMAIVERARADMEAAWAELASPVPVTDPPPASSPEPTPVAAIAGEAPAVEEPQPTAAPAFELYRDRAGEFRFRLRHPEGGNLLASEGYKSKAGARNGIASVVKNAVDGARFERAETGAGQPRFNLKAANYQVIGVSRTYETVAEMERDIAFVMQHVATAPIDDQTEE